VKLPAGACDTHAHVCGPTAIYPLVPNRLYNPPEASLADYRHMLDTLGIERAVLVQPSVYGTDNRAMLDALKLDPERLRAVAVLPFDVSRDDVQTLHALGVRGVRCNIVDLKDGKGQLPLDGLRQLAHTIQPFGWHIEFLMHVNEFDHLSSQLSDLGVPLVFGHLGYVPADLGSTPGFEGLLELSHAGKAWIKLTAPYRLTREAFPYPSTDSCADLLVREVPHRLLWGSDWPHVFIKSAMPNDGDLFNLFLGWLGGRDLMEDILVRHPAELYGF
jgi:predicted TIM-barrel fold metal-dependent hydrolase